MPQVSWTMILHWPIRLCWVAEIDQWRASKSLDDGYTAALHQVLREQGVGCRLHRQCIVQLTEKGKSGSKMGKASETKVG
jgi:hypothetical protein